MANRDRVVSQLNSYLRGLSRRRSNGIVTADDVQNYLTKKGFGMGQNERLSLTRSVLGEQNFVAVGEVPSRRPAARGRVITAWSAR